MTSKVKVINGMENKWLTFQFHLVLSKHSSFLVIFTRRMVLLFKRIKYIGSKSQELRELMVYDMKNVRLTSKVKVCNRNKEVDVMTTPDPNYTNLFFSNSSKQNPHFGWVLHSLKVSNPCSYDHSILLKTTKGVDWMLYQIWL